MKNVNLKILLILVIFLMIDISPKAYDCYYNSDDSSDKIRLVRNDGENRGADRIIINPDDNVDDFPIYPINVISAYSNWFGKSFQAGAMYYQKEYNIIQSCPKSINVYYLKSDKEYLIDNEEKFRIYTIKPNSNFETYINYSKDANDYNSILVEYSTIGISIQNKEEITAYEDHADGTRVLDAVKNNDKFRVKKFSYNSKVNTIVTPDENGIIECEYRNENNKKLKFYLQKQHVSGTAEYVEINGNGQKKQVYRVNRDNFQNLNTCPASIAYPPIEGDGYFTILNSCASSDYGNDSGLCYSEKSLPFEYADGTKKRIRYVNIRGSGAYIDVEILNAVRQDGTKVIVKQKDNELNVDINESDYINGNYPTYIIKVGDGESAKYTVTNKLNNSDSSVAKQVYMLASKVGEFGDLKLGEIEKTCEAIYGDDFIHFLKKNILNVIYIIVPILLLVLTTIDFVKVVMSNEKDGVKKAGTRFGKRVIAAILIYLTPTILIFLAEIMGASPISDCAKYIQKISKEENSSE